MDTVLQLGAIFSFCDLFEEAKKAGFEPVVCDYYKDAPCKARAKYKYDVSTLDVDALLAIAKAHDVRGIITAFSDRNLRPGMEIANALGLPTFYTHEIIDTITNKIRMKQVFADNGLPVVPYRVISEDFADSELEGLEFPVVVKPVDGYGSKGIVKCHSIADVRENLSKATGQSADFKSSIVVEECYEADEMSVSIWVKDGQAYVTCVYDVGKNFVGSPAAVYSNFPSKYTDANLREIKILAQKAVEAFKIENGPVTIQSFVGSKGIRFSELLFRLSGGGSYRHSVVMNGPNTARMLMDFWTGRDVDTGELRDFTPVCDDCYYMFRMKSRPAKELRFGFSPDEIKNILPYVCEFSQYRSDGDTFAQPTQDGDVLMRFYCKTSKNGGLSYNEMIADMEQKLSVFDENGNKVSYFIVADRDWLPEHCGAEIPGIAQITK